MVLEPGDSSYKLFHGAVWLDSRQGDDELPVGRPAVQGPRALATPAIQLLFAAFRSEYQVKLEYVRHRLQGQAVPLRHRLHGLED